MKNINEFNITDAVIERMQECADPRLKEILSALVKHMHEFAREVKLTEKELMQGIEFLTATGHMCDDKRQEFILLSDTLGLSMLAVAMNNAKPDGVTESTVFGPFHVPGAPFVAQDGDISAGAVGEPLYVTARVVSPDGKPVAGADVDVWQADEEGLYDVQRADLQHAQARAVLRTDSEGYLRFRTVLPVAYPVPTDGPVGKMLVNTGRHPWRPAHIHFMVVAQGYERLITHVFRNGDPYLESDVVFGVRSSLICDFEKHAPGKAPDGSVAAADFYTMNYEFVLQPL